MQVTWSAVSPLVDFLRSLNLSLLTIIITMNMIMAPTPKVFCEVKWANISKVLNTVPSTWQEFYQKKQKLPEHANWEVSTVDTSITISHSGISPTHSRCNPHPPNLAETRWSRKTLERVNFSTEEASCMQEIHEMKSVHTYTHTLIHMHTHIFWKSSFNSAHHGAWNSLIYSLLKVLYSF